MKTYTVTSTFDTCNWSKIYVKSPTGRTLHINQGWFGDEDNIGRMIFNRTTRACAEAQVKVNAGWKPGDFFRHVYTIEIEMTHDEMARFARAAKVCAAQQLR